MYRSSSIMIFKPDISYVTYAKWSSCAMWKERVTELCWNCYKSIKINFLLTLLHVFIVGSTHKVQIRLLTCINYSQRICCSINSLLRCWKSTPHSKFDLLLLVKQAARKVFHIRASPEMYILTYCTLEFLVCVCDFFLTQF